MQLLPLAIPPGIARPGTKYETKGRWFDGNLIRWHDRVLQPWAGWTALERSDDLPVGEALLIDATVGATDFTTEANDATANDVDLMPAADAASDRFMVGFEFRFGGLLINVGTAGVGGTVVWQYYNGTSWVALSGVADNTVGFTAAGSNSVTWTVPDDWAPGGDALVTDDTLYFVRALWQSDYTTQPLATQIFVGDGPVDVDEPIRGMLGWLANDSVPFMAFGTPSRLFVYTQGTVNDITPAGFTAGASDAVLSSGAYGAGPYGSGPYGTGDPALATLTEAQVWQLDTFGEDLIAHAYSDGDLYLWDKSVGVGTPAAVIVNAPTDNRGVVVTPERFVMALGAGGDRRLVQWSDQEDATDWTPTATNQAGDFPLGGDGEILAGRTTRNETLIWTTLDLWAARYIGGTLVYQFVKVGGRCGAISRQSMAVVNGVGLWMGRRKFHVYDGHVQDLPSEVSDYVFNDMNTTQASKIVAVVLAEKNEVRWHYPSGTSTENDRYVAYNWAENHWTIGELERTAGIDRGAFSTPMLADASGVIYQHETGTSYLDPDGAEVVPFAETGPVEIANGDRVMDVTQIIPDETTLGDVALELYHALYPTADETLVGPFTARQPTDVRVTGRQVRLRLEQVEPGWRFGVPRLMVQPGSRR